MARPSLGAGGDATKTFHPYLGFRNATAAVHMPPTPNETFPDILAGNAEQFRQLSVANASFVKGAGHIGVEAGADVFPVMRGLVQDCKVFKPIVRLVAVDVVHMLGREQFAPQALLNDPSVLVDLLPVNSNDAIAVDVAPVNELATNMTFPATERALVWAQRRSLFLERSSAGCAGECDGCHVGKVACPYVCRKATRASMMEQQEPPL